MKALCKRNATGTFSVLRKFRVQIESIKVKSDLKMLEMETKETEDSRESVDASSSETLGNSRLLELPPEVLSQILSSADRSSRLNLRLVNRYLKGMVDDYVGFHVVIRVPEEPLEAIQFYSNVAIRKAVLEHPSSIPFHILFKHPHLLEALFIEGEVSSQFMRDVFASSPSLKMLILLGKVVNFSISLEGIFFDCGVFSPCIMPNLTSLDLRIAYSVQCIQPSYLDCQHACFNMISLLRAIRAPNLQTCCFDSWITFPWNMGEVMDVLLNFMEIHFKLRGVLVYFRVAKRDGSSLDDSQEEFQEHEQIENEEELIKRLENLGNVIQLSTVILSAIPYSHLWKHFLKGQRSLRTLSFCDRACDWPPCEIPLRRNWKSLKTIYVLLHLQTQLDFTVFAECVNLTDLILINTLYREDNAGRGHDVRNFVKVLYCKKLQYCALSNLVIPSGDLKCLTKLKTLRALALLSSGYGENTGVNYSTLQEILFCRNIEALLLDGMIAADTEESRKIFDITEALASLTLPEELDDDVDVDILRLDGLNSIINIHPRPWTFQYWTRNRHSDGSGFLFNMEFSHQNP